MKNTVSLIFLYLLLQVSGLVSQEVAAQSSAVDSLRWTWEVSSTVSTQTKSCTLDFQDSLWVDWGDGNTEMIPDTMSHKVISHVYAQPGNYVCVAATNNLSYFKADSRRLLALDPTKAPRLLYLSCTSSQLTSLDVSANTWLTTLYVGKNDLKLLDVSANTCLETLTCSENQLQSLDVSGLPSLKKLTCHTNPLTSLAIHPTGALSYLSCGTCSLNTTTLDTLFESLPTLTTPSTSQNLLFANNPGSETCDPSLAVSKGWTLEKVVTKSVVALPATSVKTGDTAMVALTLSNVRPVVAFEVDILLPDGLVLDTLKTCLAAARKGQHLLSVAKTSSTTGQYKIMAYSMTSKDTLKGNEGAIVYLYFSAADTLRTYTLDLKKALLVDTAANVLDVSLSDGKLTVLPCYTFGDTDGDNLVNVTDIVWLVAAINGRAPIGFQSAAADMDDNGQLNVADIVRIVDVIHAAVYSPSMPAGYLTPSAAPEDRSSTSTAANRVASSVRLHRVYESASSMAGNHVYVRQSDSDPYLMQFCLDNTEAVQALQADIVLPAGYALTPSSFMLMTDRVKRHAVSCLPVQGASGRYRLVLWSMSNNQLFEGSEGALLTFNMQALTVVSDEVPLGEDSLAVYVEEAVLTGGNLNTLSSLTYETLLSFPQTYDDNAPKVGSDVPGQLWISANDVERIQVFTPDGRLVDEVNGFGLSFQRLSLRSGIYVVTIMRKAFPVTRLKAVVR